MDVPAVLRETAPAVFAGEPVLFAYLYGSQASGTATPRSDVAVAVYLDPGAAADELALSLRLAGALERASGAGPVEALVVLNSAPIALAGRVRDGGVVIYSRDERARALGEPDRADVPRLPHPRAPRRRGAPRPHRRAGALMVDAERVAALLERLLAEVRALRDIGARPDAELRADPHLLPAAKYRLIVAIEAG